jgi:hypothetical protein
MAEVMLRGTIHPVAKRIPLPSSTLFLTTTFLDSPSHVQTREVGY